MDSDQFEMIHAEQFNRYLLIAKAFVQRLKKNQDREIAAHWIQRLTSLTSCSAAVGKDRNHFFQYLLRVLQEAVVESMLKGIPHVLQSFKHMPIQGLHVVEDPAWLENEIDVPEIQEQITTNDAPYFAHWSNDHKSYIAAKALPGKGALIYMAVSTDPALGWSNLTE